MQKYKAAYQRKNTTFQRMDSLLPADHARLFFPIL